MTSWHEVCDQAPELTATVRARFDAHLHHVVATLRLDGSPRTSGTEVRFHDGDAWLGCMPGSNKGRDLRRDGRFSLHSAPIDTDLADGDARLEGTATLTSDPDVVRAFLVAIGSDMPSDQVELFRLDVDRVVLTTVAADRLVVTTWSSGAGIRTVSRT